MFICQAQQQEYAAVNSKTTTQRDCQMTLVLDIVCFAKFFRIFVYTLFQEI